MSFQGPSPRLRMAIPTIAMPIFGSCIVQCGERRRSRSGPGPEPMLRRHAVDNNNSTAPDNSSCRAQSANTDFFGHQQSGRDSAAPPSRRLAPLHRRTIASPGKSRPVVLNRRREIDRNLVILRNAAVADPASAATSPDATLIPLPNPVVTAIAVPAAFAVATTPTAPATWATAPLAIAAAAIAASQSLRVDGRAPAPSPTVPTLPPQPRLHPAGRRRTRQTTTASVVTTAKTDQPAATTPCRTTGTTRPQTGADPQPSRPSRGVAVPAPVAPKAVLPKGSGRDTSRDPDIGPFESHRGRRQSVGGDPEHPSPTSRAPPTAPAGAANCSMLPPVPLRRSPLP